MTKTISTHNGGQGTKGGKSHGTANRGHNLRLPFVAEKEVHINPEMSSYNEYLNPFTWEWQIKPIDEPPREAYERLFGESRKKYNIGKRTERQISDYYSHIKKSKQQTAVYEIIYQIGDDENTGIDYEKTITEREILKALISDWRNRLRCIRNNRKY